MSSKAEWKLWGPRPISFQFEKSGAFYFVGSDVASYLRLFRGKLYNQFPNLDMRKSTPSETRQIYELTGEEHHKNLSDGVTLLKVDDVDEILRTGGERFKNTTAKIHNVRYSSFKKDEKRKKNSRPVINKSVTSAAGDSQPQAQQHMDAVPCSTPVAHISKNRKKVRSFPLLLDHSEDALGENAQMEDALVPIRLDMEIEGHKLRDSFTWNRNETCLNPADFAKILCDDLELPPAHFVQAITQAIETQLEDHPKEQIIEGSTDQRVVIKLNIHVGNISLNDQIEWDMSESQNTPEFFAAELCRDLGLGGEFVTAIAYSIRGQLSWHQKTFLFTEQPLPTIKQPLRNPTDTEVWSPSLETLTNEEMEKKIRDQDRNTRRRRRQVTVVY